MMKRLFVLMVPAVLMCGCLNFEPQEDPTRFYVLKSISGDFTDKGQVKASIGLGRVIIPDYLDRAHMVVDEGRHELSFADFHRWGEDLDEGITRVMGQNLQHRTRYYNVLAAPWCSSIKRDYDICLRIEDFVAQAETGCVHLHAQYQIKDTRGEALRSGHYNESFSIVGSVSDYAAIAEAMSYALADLSDQIVRGIEAL